jgi:acyl-CoA synthetase (AMP-forming)/AMP-acid ligase II
MSGDLAFTTIPGCVRSAAERFGDTEALVDGDVRMTFTELAEAVTGATRAMMASGIEPGDRVSIWAPNIYQWVICALGLSSSGAILVPLNTRFKGKEAAYVLGKSGARTLFAVGNFLDTDYVAALRDSGVDLPALRDIVIFGNEAPEGTTTWDEFCTAGSSVSADAAAARAAGVKGEDLSDILFTSGTTGNPKGVMANHAQSMRAYIDWTEMIGLRAGDRYLVVNPFFHNFGYKAGFIAAMMRGATTIPLAVFDVDKVLELVQREHVTTVPGPPTLFMSILNHPQRDDHDLSSLRLAITGAASVPVEMILRMRSEMTFETTITGYGLTEATGLATMSRPDDDAESIALTSGRAIPDTEVRVVDDKGAEMPPGEPGEVVVRGYNVMQGYFDEPEQTAETIDADGWLHTGDIGVMDERGCLRVTDRIKDMFIVGGFNAYPAEIEGVLMRHPGVAQAAVVGTPDERMGEVGVAFVVPRPGATVDPDEVVAWSREEMANYKVPRKVLVVDALPLNASGKVVKYELREQAQAST